LKNPIEETPKQKIHHRTYKFDGPKKLELQQFPSVERFLNQKTFDGIESKFQTERKTDSLSVLKNKRELNHTTELGKDSPLNKRHEEYSIHRYSIPKGLKILHKSEKRARRLFQSKFSFEVESPFINKESVK